MKIPAEEYIIRRSLFRPRDVINFINICIAKSAGKSTITASKIKDAEATYSELRYRAIGDEWIEDYPNLLNSLKILREKEKTFIFNEISEKIIEDFVIDTIGTTANSSCLIYQLCQNCWDEHISFADVRNKLLKIFYMVGAIGVRTRTSGLSWSFEGENILQDSEILGNEKVEICPMFYRVLGVSPK